LAVPLAAWRGPRLRLRSGPEREVLRRAGPRRGPAPRPSRCGAGRPGKGVGSPRARSRPSPCPRARARGSLLPRAASGSLRGRPGAPGFRTARVR
jgi:hypothetical protein